MPSKFYNEEEQTQVKGLSLRVLLSVVLGILIISLVHGNLKFVSHQKPFPSTTLIAVFGILGVTISGT